jgi:hypothetical protein
MQIVSSLHSLAALFMSFYGFLFRRSKYDYLILCITYTIALLWSLYKGECPLSYYFKKYKDPNYVLGSSVYADDIYIVFGPKYVPMMKLFYSYFNPIIQTTTLYLLLKRQHFSTGVTFVYPLFFYGYYFMTRFLHSNVFDPFFTVLFAYILYDIIRQSPIKLKYFYK